MAFKVLYGNEFNEDLKADYKSTIKIGSYRFSKKALYFPSFPTGAKYIPISAIDGAWVRKSRLSITGCCAGQIPVFILHVRCGSDYSNNLTFDNKAAANKALELLQEYIPNLIEEPSENNQ